MGIKSGKTEKNIQKIRIFSSESFIFHSCCSFLKSNESDSLASLFCKERPDQFTDSRSFVQSDESNFVQGRSFLKSDESQSLTVAL